MTFDYAIELLEVTDINQVNVEDVQKLVKKAKRRWHPDTISHQKDEEVIQEYTHKFQEVEKAGELLLSYLKGEYNAGEAFKPESTWDNREPEDIIRENATELQSDLEIFFEKAKENRFKWHQEEVLLSDGFVLADLIQGDYDDDIVSKAIVSLSYGGLVILLTTALLGIWVEAISWIGMSVLFFHVTACLLAALPLSRIWMNEQVTDIVLQFVNFGLNVQMFFLNSTRNSHAIIQLIVTSPFLFSRVVKYIILLPLTVIAKAIVRDKVVGVVTETVDYYAGAADWYINKLIQTTPSVLETDDLYNLSYLHGQLKGVQAI
jgi:hypothetical protein